MKKNHHDRGILSRMAFVALLPSIVCVQVSIAQQNPALPDARARAHLIYHPKSKALLLFDGYVTHLDSTRNNVWKWDGKRWDLVEAYGPGSRSGNSAALNNQSGHVQMFGGWGKGSIEDHRDDTWGFDGSQWFNLKTNPMEAHDHHKMVFADHLKAFVVYGGRNSITGQPDSTTWLLKEGQFTALSIPSPGPRGNMGFAYDPGRKKVVLLGGKRYDLPADLWEFDGKKWEQVPVEDIGIKTGHAMTYSEDRSAIVVHGTNGETWAWNGKTMTKIASGGPVGTNLALGNDRKRKVIVAYGGFGANNTIKAELWELKADKWEKISDNGTWMQVSRNKYERMKDEVADAFNRANTLVSDKHLPEAENVLLKAISAGIKSSTLYAHLGQIQYQLGKYQEGTQAYEKLVELKPLGRDFYDLARGYAKINEKDKAFAALYKAIENGYGTQEHLEGESDLAPLRTDSRYKRLLEKLK